MIGTGGLQWMMNPGFILTMGFFPDVLAVKAGLFGIPGAAKPNNVGLKVGR